MRFLGVDFGTKRIGVAISDENGSLAFPKEIVSNDASMFDKFRDIIKKENIQEIIVGESLDSKGNPNAVYEKAEKFLGDLKKEFKLPIHKEKEFFTSLEARRYVDEGKADAKAAALILQRYLDKINKR